MSLKGGNWGVSLLATELNPRVNKQEPMILRMQVIGKLLQIQSLIEHWMDFLLNLTETLKRMAASVSKFLATAITVSRASPKQIGNHGGITLSAVSKWDSVWLRPSKKHARTLRKTSTWESAFTRAPFYLWGLFKKKFKKLIRSAKGQRRSLSSNFSLLSILSSFDNKTGSWH